MQQALIDFLRQHGLSPRVIIFIISMLPVLELRGGLIAAAVLNVPMWEATAVCLIGNILPMPLILIFLERVIKFLKRFRLFRRPVGWLEHRAEKGGKGLKRGEFWGLLIFVGIPLPGTGGWTGALIASALKMPLRRSLPAIACGIVMACVIMLTLTYFIPGLFGLGAQ